MTGRELYDDCVSALAQGVPVVMLKAPVKTPNAKRMQLGAGLTAEVIGHCDPENVVIRVKCADVVRLVDARRKQEESA